MKRERCADEAVYVHEYPPELAFILTQRPLQQFQLVSPVEAAAAGTEDFEYADMKAESSGSSDFEVPQADDGNALVLNPPLPAPDTSGGDWMLEFYETFDQVLDNSFLHFPYDTNRMRAGAPAAAPLTRSDCCASRRAAPACWTGKTKAGNHSCSAVSRPSSIAPTAPSMRKYEGATRIVDGTSARV